LSAGQNRLLRAAADRLLHVGNARTALLNALFHPLRLALTGREKGPELKALLPLIGRAHAAARLTGQAA